MNLEHNASRRSSGRAIIVLAAVWGADLVGCESQFAIDRPGVSQDSGQDPGPILEPPNPALDGGDTDAGGPDGGNFDGGHTDAGSPDAGGPDAGTPDAGKVDAGTPDAGQVDAGTPPPSDGGISAAPSSPPALICGNTSLLTGPSTPPAGAITVPAGNNSSFDFGQSNAVYWFAPGTHTLGTGQYSQIIPANGSTFIGGPGAILDGQHSNLYAFTQHAKNVTLRYFTIQNFGTPGSTNNEGTVNHDAGDGWLIEYMTIQQNSGAGVFVGSNNTVRYNCIRNNGQYGFSSYSPTGISHVVLDHNEISGNNTDDWETRQPGCGCTGGGKFWATTDGTVTNNYIHDNKSVGLWADTNNVGFDFSGNYISNNDDVGILYEISYNVRIAHNTFIKNALVAGPTNPGFPTGAIYLSESGGDSRVGNVFDTVDVSNNFFEDNWGGVVLWENADRFCNSPANTSDGDCTLVGAASLSTCVSGTINNAPYYSDCRWKTQNVAVHDNIFNLTPSHIGSTCTPNNTCGFQGVFSNYGTYPSWSPYQGNVIGNAITFNQNNVFHNNTYTGPWNFMAHDQGTILTPAKWQAAPYNQDVGSVFK